MMVSGKLECGMEEVNKFGKMDQYMKDIEKDI